MHLEAGTIGHVWRHALLRGRDPSQVEYRLLIGQALLGRVWCAVDGDNVLAIGGTYAPDEQAKGRVWLSIVPGIGRRLGPAVRLMRQRLADDAARYQPLVCVVRDENMAGRRLAQLLGFTETESRSGTLREWRFG